VGGLSRANVSICTTIVADDCPKEMRPKGMACIGIAFSVGFVVGKICSCKRHSQTPWTVEMG